MNKWMGKELNVWMNQGIVKWDAWKTKQEESSFIEEVKKIILEKWNHIAWEANSNGLHSQRL